MKRILLLVLATILLGITGLYFFQEKMIFHPTVLQQDYSFNFEQDFEELFLKADDGAVLNALHFKLEHPRGIIVYYHGNAGDLSRWGTIVTPFLDYKYEVLIMDYRSYGKSTGIISEAALYSDAQLFYNEAKSLFPEDKIVVYGRSLGTAMATYVASNNQPQQLILETPFYDFKELARQKMLNLPIAGLLKYEFPSYRFIKTVDCPVTVIHGTADRVVPYTSGLELYHAIPGKQRMLVKIKGGTHNDLIRYPAFHDAISDALH